MPRTVKAKLLLGWMAQTEAMAALNACVFDEPLTPTQATGLWETYRDKVAALEPRKPAAIERLEITPAEKQAIDEHVKRVKASASSRFLADIVKIDPRNLIARQFHVLTDHSAKYAKDMETENARINGCLGVGLQFGGQLVMRQVNANLFAVDLPHSEYVIIPNPKGVHLQERDRYIVIVPNPEDRLVLWGGYHRTHAVLCQMAGDAAGVAPLLTVMTGIPEVEQFFARPSPERDTVLGERPALLRDFFNEELFISVNLQRTRAEARIEQFRPGQFRAGIFLVKDDA